MTASGASADFDNRELLVYLAEVDAELPVPDDGEPVEIAVIGGAAIGFLVPGRVTDDVDVISEGMPEKLRVAATLISPDVTCTNASYFSLGDNNRRRRRRFPPTSPTLESAI